MTPGLPTLDWPALYPVLIVTVACFACLLLDASPRRRRPGVLAATGVLGVVGATGVSVLLWGGPATTFQGMLVVDGFALFLNVVIGAAAVLVLLLSVGYLPRQGVVTGEYYALVALRHDRHDADGGRDGPPGHLPRARAHVAVALRARGLLPRPGPKATRPP